jgi:hypothetical protein
MDEGGVDVKPEEWHSLGFEMLFYISHPVERRDLEVRVGAQYFTLSA